MIFPLQEPDTAAAAGQALELEALLAPSNLVPLLRAALLVLLGLPVAAAAARMVRRAMTRTYSPHRGMIAGKLLFYVAAVVILVSAMAELGFSVAPLLGAAGIVGIALGFASQTSVSNVISGLFLMAEQPFVVDDIIQVGNTVGRVLSIDMMSVKLRTFDNRFVRIPNETIVKSEVTTVTRFPIRRVDVNVGVAYKEDVGRVRQVLLDVARENVLALRHPEPLVLVQGFGSSSIDLMLAVWATKENWRQLKNTIQEELKVRFDREGIEIPFPHQSVYAGTATTPFPIRIVADGEAVPGRVGGGRDPEEPPAPSPAGRTPSASGDERGTGEPGAGSPSGGGSASEDGT